MRRLRHALAEPAVKLVIICCALTPRPLLKVWAGFIGHILPILPLPSNRIIARHRGTIMADRGINVSAARVYSSLLFSFFDFFHLSRRGDETFSKIVRVKGAENLRRALEEEKGVIAVTGHFSAWELIPRAVKLLGVRTGVVGRSLTHPGASGVLERLRAAPGIHVIDRDAGVSPLVRLFRKNTAVGILIDQDTSRVQSEFAEFLGVPARTPVAPAVLSKRLGIPVVTLHITRGADGNYLMEIDPPVHFGENDSLQGFLSMLNERIGGWIEAAPEQWVWFHDRWRKKRKVSGPEVDQ